MYSVFTWLFFLTAAVATWAAYDRVAALEKLALLGAGLAAAHLIDRLGRIDAERTLRFGGIACAGLAALLGTLPLVTDLGSDYVLRAGVIAAALIILLPLGSGSVAWLWQRRFWFAAVVVGLAAGWALAMLILTRERSAWFALGVGIVSGWLVGQRFDLARRGRRVWPFDLLGVGGLAACLIVYVLAIAMPGLQPWLPLGNRGTVIEHLQVWRNALVLIQDYPLTGSGLNVTAMVYSTYAILLHVPYRMHVHNLYLQTAVEQGLLGLLALLGMAAAVGYALAAAWRNGSRSGNGLRSAALAALTAMLCHGLLDSELYASWLAPLLFLPFGFVSVAARLDQYVVDDARFGRQNYGKRLVAGSAMGLAGLAIAVLLAVTPGVQAAFQANLGAVAQTRAELSVYSWQEWSIQDEVRRTHAVTLAPAIARYEAALSLHPNNVTALRRLGQISLSRGDYESARRYLERAYAHAPQQRIVQFLLGETLAVTGQVEEGAALWHSAAIHPYWLNQRRWWYTHIGATHQAAWFDEAIAAADRQSEAIP
jgi:tetratricopeptide (TPR) repeat protein